MSNTQQLRRRIKSISNTRQITKAMELVAASKMRKAQNQVLASRPYSNVIEYVLGTVGSGVDRTKHPLLRTGHRGPTQKIAFILIAPDKGLAGSLVTNIMRETLQFINQNNTHELNVITIERKARDFILKTGNTIIADFASLQSPPTLRDTNPIARLVIDGYTKKTFDQVYIGYTHFINTVSQKPIIKKILPIENTKPDQDESARNDSVEFRFEPSPDDILESLLPRYIEVEIYQAVAEAAASEHSARMVAMKNASDNAKDIIYDLQLTYNTTRQGAITQELAEVTAGANAV
ncbi:ATP synthase F1 subunit gamma [Candidatus Berkelbacteria bacterium CG06_land_8_20_14_3_00_43_10]|uniref:ATP synthase gamma chain n=1 Tax=Candidatus Berkelbacteria bacterium CG10_big_fil_rev_8_21_14_0_10_43_14 TaxID=1974515 RepID=A0A2M6R9J9_9BACT|nr:MAG: ATP synthase F1 subunit gamma [Candidatus Berkelbacteria bacterium CG2_30_43_20]PIS07225.1 MAG: ATP synthase F1 subunit gamma [Candidatus Berkelbacteria bacterium CG10_big_fil_rev_8_21_14_0_10_43_14]PIU87312.1 MAG: ATP synthase F1 subunit gamma [Candidatus Berkelbacteria bacterium CG06_land_8_20_14_3_00_43_10]